MNARPLQLLSFFWSRPAAAPAVRGRVTVRAGEAAIRLRRRQVMTIGGAAAAAGIRVQQGAVWLTGTPGKYDVVLQAQESLVLPNHYPFVIEALTDAEIVLGR